MRAGGSGCKAQSISPARYMIMFAERSRTLVSAPRMRRPGSAPTAQRMVSMATDPVCKMEVDPRTAKWKSIYDGKEYYFCAPGCKSAFDKNPKKYI